MTETLTPTPYSITPYRYAKGKLVVHCPSPNGFKTRAGRLAGSIGRWVNRAGGYLMSPHQVERFEALYRDGWDACTFTSSRIPPREGLAG